MFFYVVSVNVISMQYNNVKIKRTLDEMGHLITYSMIILWLICAVFKTICKMFYPFSSGQWVFFDTSNIWNCSVVGLSMWCCSPPSLWTASLTSGSVTSAAGLAAGPDGCLLELDYLPCCKVVCLWCFCCWGVFPVLTLYSPRSIVWGLFFFSSLSSCYAVFFFKKSLHFTADCTLYDCVCDK